MLITIEGMDGSGKTTLIDKIFNLLVDLQIEKNFVFTREPGGVGISEAEKLREIILDSKTRISDVSEALLYSASRRIHIDRVIAPNIKDKIIICDRYIDSFYAYQGYGRQLGIEWVKQLTELIIGEFKPDLTFFIDITYEQTEARRVKRNTADRLESQHQDFFTRVYDGYQKLIAEDRERFIILDGQKSADELATEVIEHIKKYAKLRGYLNA